MEVYKFKCKCCGSTKYEKINDTTYKCKYCENTEEIVQKQVEKIIIEKTAEECLSELSRAKENFISALINMLIVVGLGVFGVHKFIKGKILLGIFYIFTYGLFGIGLFVDAIKALVKVIETAKVYRISKG